MADDAAVTFHSPVRRKVYLDDEMSGVRVPWTEVRLGGSAGRHLPGSGETVRLYDTSGPGCDPEVGLPSLRQPWILDRGDVERYDGRPIEHRDDGRAAHRRGVPGGPLAGPNHPGAAMTVSGTRQLLRARPGSTAVTQRHYAALR